MSLADNIVKAHRAKEAAKIADPKDGWEKWAAKNPELNHLLIEAMILAGKDGQ